MNLRPRPGYCFVACDPDEEWYKSLILYVDGIKPKPKTGLCVQHQQTFDEDFQNKRVVFDRWSATPFKVLHEGKEYEFYNVSQYNVLAVIEEQEQTNDPRRI